MKKIPMLIAAGAGYVLGARAGHERYEQIKAGAARVRRDPRVQDATQRATDTVKEKAGEVASDAVEAARRQNSMPPAP
ncbi:hypothetical protein ABKW28_21295 [Nocardioides sp. 31GB23]|uniref:YtxH domain-containing protein n=1 Tax=Nocardioides salarius TaxID=374513 RepID=A0ABS2M8B5_9ACTN|nr:hypothetical protein [Nocardioides salarius]MBM7507429.1 hypothetical protein [Nocardioides salarius]